MTRLALGDALPLSCILHMLGKKKKKGRQKKETTVRCCILEHLKAMWGRREAAIMFPYGEKSAWLHRRCILVYCPAMRATQNPASFCLESDSEERTENRKEPEEPQV
ncbi:uncharacterized protein RBU33_025134 isoform 1-T1 [Hipposideros larvatus]